MEKENNDGDGDGDFYLFFDNMVMEEEEEEDMIMMGKRGREASPNTLFQERRQNLKSSNFLFINGCAIKRLI